MFKFIKDELDGIKKECEHFPSLLREQYKETKKIFALEPEKQKFENLFAREQEYIATWRNTNKAEKAAPSHKTAPPNPDSGQTPDTQPLASGAITNLTALCLSGGGIRSATFCLGVLQALAEKKLFHCFDYLSTVSGGGYIGGSITWLKKNSLDQSAEYFPYGGGDDSSNALLSYLKSRGNYLAPGGGITKVSLAGVILRAMFLNLLVWVPLATFIFWTLILPFDAPSDPGFTDNLWPELSPFINEAFLDSLKTDQKQIIHYIFNLWYVDDGLFSAKGIISQNQYQRFKYTVYFSLALVFVLILIWISFSLATATWFWQSIFSLKLEGTDRYWWRRRLEKHMSTTLKWIVCLFLIGIIPLVNRWIEARGGVFVVLVGMGGAGWTFLNTQNKKSSSLTNWIVPIAAILILYGMLIECFNLAVFLSIQKEIPWWAYFIFIASILTGYIVDLNLITTHRYYRDRIMEAFMPDPGKLSEITKGEVFLPGQLADNADLHGFSTSPKGPYHIINTNLVLVDSSVSKYQLRGGDNFILSPLGCGSAATGWAKTEEFLSGNISLPTAVAASGAAVNPNSGCGGAGLTRNKWISLLMALLNIRLGIWVPNPNKDQKRSMNHFLSAWQEIGNRYDENFRFLHLSDGGHFENLGLYEMIRRKVKLIVVCDAGADPDFTFADLRIALRRIKDDFNATVYFPSGTLELLMQTDVDGPHYPRNLKLAKQGYIEGTITYADGEKNKNNEDGKWEKDANKGKLIYLTTTMSRNLAFNFPILDIFIKGYLAEHPDFPDETTADQFFSEEQFEAYRKLGYGIGQEAIDGVMIEAIKDAIIKAIQGVETEKIDGVMAEAIKGVMIKEIQGVKTEKIYSEMAEAIKDAKTKPIKDVMIETIKDVMIETIQGVKTEKIYSEMAEAIKDEKAKPIKDVMIEAIENVKAETIQSTGIERLLQTIGRLTKEVKP